MCVGSDSIASDDAGPIRPHPDSKQGPQQQKRPEIRRERSWQFDDRIKNDVDHQQDAAAESIAQPSNERTDRAHHQRHSDSEGDLLDASPKFLPDRRKTKVSREEIELRPKVTEETSDESVALCTVQRFEEPDRFHDQSPKCHVEQSRDISPGISAIG